MFKFIIDLFRETRSEASVSKSSNAAAFQVANPPAPAASFAPVTPVATPAVYAPTAASQPSGPCIEIPLTSIADRLSPALRSRMTRLPSSTDIMRLPLAVALEQLPRGAVRVQFRELRTLTAPGLFTGGTDADDASVELPLPEVLARLKHGHLARRAQQKDVSLSTDLPSLFSPRQPNGNGKPEARFEVKLDQQALSRSTSNSSPGVTPPKPASIPAPGPHHAAPPSPRTDNRKSEPTSIPNRRPVAPSPPEPVRVPFASLTAGWPEGLKREAMARCLAASVHIPLGELESAMKRGKAIFTWKQIRMWTTPPPAVDLAENDGRQLELPLSVLAPLFLSRLSGSAGQKKVTPVVEMPDVFARKSEETTVRAPAPAAPTLPEPRPITLERRITDSLASIPAAAGSKEAPLSFPTISMQSERRPVQQQAILPSELVERACRLGGVSGALLASSDGLAIASQLPAGMSAETAAAFLPQISVRLAQYTQALKLGKPSELEVLVEGIPLHIRSIGENFFAVLGKAGESLPKLQLGSLAGQLSQRTQ